MPESNISKELFTAILKANAAKPRTGFYSSIKIEWNLVEKQLQCSLTIPIKTTTDTMAGNYVIDVPDFLEPELGT